MSQTSAALVVAIGAVDRLRLGTSDNVYTIFNVAPDVWTVSELIVTLESMRTSCDESSRSLIILGQNLLWDE